MRGAAGGGAAAAGAAGHVAAVANAIKACGTVVRVEPAEFEKILALQERPPVVLTVGGIFSPTYVYLTSYRGLAFFTKSPDQILLPGDAELVHARKMAVPSL
jgi:hypothetical protein